MADSTIPGLVAVATPALTDLFGVRQSGDTRDKKLTASQLASLIGGGDVFKVGTPVDNQLGVWTGDGTIEGDANLTWDAARLTIGASGLILPAGSAAGPSQVFTGSLATGWYTPVANVISASIAGVQKWSIQVDKINSAGSGGGLNFAASRVIPGLFPRATDLNTGIGGDGADVLTAVAGGLEGQHWREANAGVQSGYLTSPTVTAFATGGQGGATVLINSYNVVTTVATTGDSVRLQTNHDLGTVVYCKNEGANSLDIFPASGDDLGAGLNTAVAIPAGEWKAFITTVAQTTWTELLPVAAGGGDVFKVGTPANDELAVWTGDGTLEGSANFDVVGTQFRSATGNGPAIVDEAASSSNPTLIPRQGDLDTGVTNVGDDRLGLVAGAELGMQLVAASGGVIHGFDIDAAITAFAGGGQGSAVQLNQSYNIVTTVATTGDSVKLPPINHVGGLVYVKNNGANACDVFPAAGDDLGQGTNVALSVGVGGAVTFMHSVANTTWTQIQFEITATAVFPEFQFYADQMDNPVTADWAVNALAPASADNINSGLTIRRFDDTTEEGIGLIFELPSGATSIVLDFVSRAISPAGAARTVGLELYDRGQGDNVALSTWSAGLQLTDIDVPNNTNFQFDSQTITFATLGVTAGEVTQFELTRVNPTGGTELVGDWALLLVKVSFT